MIKGISILRPAGTAAEYERLASFFSALGFGPGSGWDDEQSRGASFLAPLGNLEIIQGKMPGESDVFVEVTHLDAIREAALAWVRKQGGEASVSDVTETYWKSRLFTVEPVPGKPFTFWELTDPFAGKPVAVEGDLSAEGMHFAIVVARWNAVITDRLLDGALDGLLRSGAARRHIEIVRVPGAWEIPAAARTIAERIPANGGPGRVDAIITLGCLLRGETAHYEAIYNEVSRGIGQSQQETGIPHAFGVLTCETLEQALNRAGVKAGNKGFEAAVAAIEMVSLRRKLLNSEGCMSSTGTRRKSRELAMQMLFQGDMGKQTPEQVGKTFWVAREESDLEVRGFAQDLYRVATARSEEIDDLISAHLVNWRLERMPGVDRNVLRLAVAEMLGFKGTPFPIIINEALEIARRYSAPESVGFLNGVLDALAKELVKRI